MYQEQNKKSKNLNLIWTWSKKSYNIKSLNCSWKEKQDLSCLSVKSRTKSLWLILCIKNLILIWEYSIKSDIILTIFTRSNKQKTCFFLNGILMLSCAFWFLILSISIICSYFSTDFFFFFFKGQQPNYASMTVLEWPQDMSCFRVPVKGIQRKATSVNSSRIWVL